MHNNGSRERAGVPLWTFFYAGGHGKTCGRIATGAQRIANVLMPLFP
jgi:hypothetical protein